MGLPAGQSLEEERGVLESDVCLNAPCSGSWDETRRRQLPAGLRQTLQPKAELSEVQTGRLHPGRILLKDA